MTRAIFQKDDSAYWSKGGKTGPREANFKMAMAIKTKFNEGQIWEVLSEEELDD